MKEKDIQDFDKNHLRSINNALRSLPNDVYMSIIDLWHIKPARLRFSTNDDSKWYHTYADVVMAISEVLNER